MNAPKVLVTRPPPVPIDLAAALPGAVVTVSPHDRGLSPGELAHAAEGFDALITQLTDRVDDAFLDAHPRLRVIANVAVGHENLDAAAGAKRGVWMTNTPGVLTEATANLTMGLLLSATRRLFEGETLVRTGRWEGFSPGLLLGHDLQGKTLGLVGFGRIAQAVARRARVFGLQIIATSRRPLDVALRDELGVEEVTLPGLLEGADIVSLHAPLTPETRRLIDAHALAAMRPGSLLINTARGPLVDEDALADALERGHLGGAALDVHEHEPRVHPRLLTRPDVVLLPHLGSATHETRDAMLRLALRNVAAVLAGETPPTPIVPTITPREGRHDKRADQTIEDNPRLLRPLQALGLAAFAFVGAFGLLVLSASTDFVTFSSRVATFFLPLALGSVPIAILGAFVRRRTWFARPALRVALVVYAVGLMGLGAELLSRGFGIMGPPVAPPSAIQGVSPAP